MEFVNMAIDTPEEADVRFQGYRLEVVSHWPPSPRKVAAAEAISQRLTTIARSALVRPDIADLIHLSCRLLDDFFEADDGMRAQHDPFGEQTVHRALDVY
jgi:hypothetical protein